MPIVLMAMVIVTRATAYDAAAWARRPAEQYSARMSDQVHLRAALSESPRTSPASRRPRVRGRRRTRSAATRTPIRRCPACSRRSQDARPAMNRYPDMAVGALSQALADSAWTSRSSTSSTGTGSVGVLGQLIQATCDPGDEVVYAWRSFEAYPIVAPSPARRPCRCRWTPTPGTTSRRCSPRSPSGPAWCWSAPQQPDRAGGPPGRARRLPRPGAPGRAGGHSTRPTSSSSPTPTSPTARDVPAAAQRRGPAHLQQGVRAGRPAGRLRRRARAGRRGAAQDRRAVRRQRHRPAGRRRQPRRRTTSCRSASTRWSPSVPGSSRPLREQGWAVPQTEANFVWLPLGDRHARLRRGGGRGGSRRAAVPRRGRALHRRRDRGQRPAGRGRRAVPLPSPRVSSWCRGVRQID